MRILYCAFAALFVCGTICAQELNLEPLRAPTAPAATIISIQPNEVSQPKTAKDLEAALMTNYFAQGGLNIPNNFMLEAMPYWLSNRRNINPTSYIDPQGANKFWQNLSLSIASTQNFIIQDSIKSNAMGFGFRSLLRKGGFLPRKQGLLRLLEVNQGLQTALAILVTTIGSTADPTGTDPNIKEYIKTIINATLADPNLSGLNTSVISGIKSIFEDRLIPIGDNYTTPAQLKNDLRAEAADIISENHQAVVKSYQEYKDDRKGLQLEIAGAVSLNFPTNEVEFSTVPKYGIWLTGTVNPSTEKESKFLSGISLIFMLRYIRNDYDYFKKYLRDSTDFSQNNIDLGIRGLYQTGKFTAGIELIGRYRQTLLSKENNADGTVTKTESTGFEAKYAFNISYRISPSILLNYTFGKSLEPAFSVNGNIISTASLNFGFGGPKTE